MKASGLDYQTTVQKKPVSYVQDDQEEEDAYSSGSEYNPENESGSDGSDSETEREAAQQRVVQQIACEGTEEDLDTMEVLQVCNGFLSLYSLSYQFRTDDTVQQQSVVCACSLVELLMRHPTMTTMTKVRVCMCHKHT